MKKNDYIITINSATSGKNYIHYIQFPNSFRFFSILFQIYKTMTIELGRFSKEKVE